MSRRSISSNADAALETWRAQLEQGDLHIGDLPLSLEAYIHLGYALGRDSRDREVEQLERDVNRWYYLATTNPAQRRANIEARLAAALEQASTEQWNQLDKDLADMARHGTNTFESAAEAEIEGTHDRTSSKPRRWQQAA